MVGQYCFSIEFQKGEDTNEEIVAEKTDYMYEYVTKIAPEDRNAFAAFWNRMYSYYLQVTRAMRENKNEGHYEFDIDRDSSSVPNKVMEIFDVTSLYDVIGADKHTNYKMTIDGTDVSLYFDNYKFFPSEYSYGEICELILEME